MKKSEKAKRIVAAIDRLIQEGFKLTNTEWQDCHCGLSGCGFYEPTWRTQDFHDELAKLNHFWHGLRIDSAAEFIIDEEA